MKKIANSILLILIITFNFYIFNSFSAINATTHSENNNYLITYDDRYLLRQIDIYRDDMLSKEAELDIYDTESLVEKIINSEINNIYYYNTIAEGLNILKNNNAFYKELLTRDDAISKLINLYRNADYIQNVYEKNCVKKGSRKQNQNYSLKK